MQCPKCGESAPDEARFCETCGVRLSPATTAGAVASAPESPASADISASSSLGMCPCGEGPEAIDEQGFCTGCGRRRVAPARDHKEETLAPHFAGVTDRGRRHPRNEDDMALALETSVGPVSILVVCDGVSTSHLPDDASAAASTCAKETLLEAVRRNETDLEAAMATAIRAAHDAVCALQYTPGGDLSPPATTIVAAVAQGDRATLGWVGDSRAYWISPQEARLLTHDHSWVNEMVDAGQMTEEEALKAPEAHAITQALGPVEAEAGEDPNQPPEPSLWTVTLSAPGRLILCSDGLWNYASSPEQLAELVHKGSVLPDALSLARELTAYAIAQGGRDNITVVILDLSHTQTPENPIPNTEYPNT